MAAKSSVNENKENVKMLRSYRQKLRGQGKVHQCGRGEVASIVWGIILTSLATFSLFYPINGFKTSKQSTERKA